MVAPGPFKGTLRATQVAAAVGRGLERAGLAPPDLCPVADGGAGTIDAVLPRLGGTMVGEVALLGDGEAALVEDPALLAAAVDLGSEVVIVAAGRSDATVPAEIEARGAKIIVLCDVGVAGRATSGPWAALGARLEPGGPWVLDALEFDVRMRRARAVITGEGRLDPQTLRGRVVGEIGTRARQAGVPLHAIVGRDALDRFGKRMIDLQRVLEASTLPELEAAGEALGRELADGRA